jgi:hypothetical protein
MLWQQMQSIIRLFMIVALVVSTIPHSHAVSSHLDLGAEHVGLTQSQGHHDHDDHDHDPAPAKSGWDHSHGAAIGDHVHEKAVPAQDLAILACRSDADWYASFDDERMNAPTGRLERPPRADA